MIEDPEKSKKRRFDGSSILSMFLLVALVIAWNVLRSRWHRIRDTSSVVIGRVIDINHKSNSFVLSRYDGTMIDEYQVDGEMPLGIGKCLYIELRPAIVLEIFQDKNEHHVHIIRATSSFQDDGVCYATY